jgi:hypothetical protein
LINASDWDLLLHTAVAATAVTLAPYALNYGIAAAIDNPMLLAKVVGASAVAGAGLDVAAQLDAGTSLWDLDLGSVPPECPVRSESLVIR